MSRCVEIVERGEPLNDSGIRNGWRWEWCDKTIHQQRAGEFIKKLKMTGLAYYTLCETEIQYGSKGFTALSGHMSRAKHLKLLKVRRENQTLPGKEPGFSKFSQGSMPQDPLVSLPPTAVTAGDFSLFFLVVNPSPEN